jgi:hypothetical protein
MVPTGTGNLRTVTGVYHSIVPASFPKPLSGRVGMLAQTASLGITGVLIWNSAVRPRLIFEKPSAILAHALLYACLAWFFAAVITVALYFTLARGETDQVIWSTFRTAGVAVWFAPACILLSQLSPATLIAALVLVITATRLLYSEWSAGKLVEQAPVAATPGLFGSWAVRPPVFTRELFTGLAAAVSLQAGVVSVWRHKPLFAGFWFVLSAAIVTLFAMVSGAVEDSRPPTLPRSVFGMAMAVLLASGLTVGGLRVARGSGDGDAPGGPGSGKGAVASAKEVLRDLFGDDQAAPGEKIPGAVPLLPAVTPGIAPDGSFPGVILWPEVKPVTRLVAPPPQGLSTGTAPARPYTIPFAGQYLLFRFPQRRPPPTSILQRGSPATLAFSTVDHWPLNMEAIQKLDEPIDLSCCRALRVEIWNADRFPGTVALELYADDRLLGSMPVRSAPDLQRDPIVAAPESLEFPITAGGMCTELKVTFRRARTRADKSARIAIERFVLVP